MATQKFEISLLDAETSIMYNIMVSADEAKRLETDLVFATEKMQEAMKANINDLPIATPELGTNASTSDNCDEAAQAFKWPHDAIILLIEEYRVREPDFTSGKISQKRVWEEIAKSMGKGDYNITGPQCMSKFAGLKRTYKSVKDHNNKSGNGPRSWPYLTVMDDLLSKKPFMSPVATTSSTGKRSRTLSESSSTSTISSDHSDDTITNTPKKPRKMSTAEELLQQRVLAEEATERRHNENVELKKSLLKSFNKLIELLQNEK